MEAIEFRIGNYVDLGNRIAKVIEIYSKAVTVVDLEETQDTLECLESRVKPIILSEKWLVNFGFKKNAEWFSNSLFEINIEERGAHVRLIMGGISKYLLHIKYVHQLQNLYFALTGEELTING